MRRVTWLAAVVLLMLTAAVHAEERVLQWDSGEASLYEHLATDCHFILYEAPRDWDKTFTREVTFYAKRYGDVGTVRGTVVILGPQTDKTLQLEDAPDSLVIHYRKQFPLADVPEQADWFSVPIEVIELPSEFAVGVFTYSTDDWGVELGLTPPSNLPSHSSAAQPGPVDPGEDANIFFRDDGRDWLIRLGVGSTPGFKDMVTSADLTGEYFTAYDDGEAEGYVTTQRYGPMIRVTNVGGKIIDRIYVYAMVEGDWFETERAAGVYLLNPDYGIIVRGSLPYNMFTNEPSWGYAKLDNVPVPEDFYVLIEPVSRPQVKLLLGYDSSSSNQASVFGTPGARKNWETEAPEERTNWMIRVHYR